MANLIPRLGTLGFFFQNIKLLDFPEPIVSNKILTLLVLNTTGSSSPIPVPCVFSRMYIGRGPVNLRTPSEEYIGQ